MQFLELPDDILIEIFQLIEGPTFRKKFVTLSAIRRTCKRLAPLVQPQMFTELQTKIDGLHVPTVNELADIHGRHVRTLRLDLRINMKVQDIPSDTHIHDLDVRMAILISKLPSVRELDVLAPCDKTVSLPNLTYALRDFHEVRHFRLIEETSRTRDNASDVVHGLSDDLICALTKFNGKNLTSFVFDGDSFASAEAFTTVRDHMPRLSTLLVRSWIGPRCFQILQEDTPWACTDTLQVLSLQNCQAITADIVARGLSTKRWATNLRILELIRCGVHGSSHDLSQTFPLPIPTLQRLTLEHPSAWELDILAKLPARHVTLTLLPRECAKQLVQEGMFPRMEKLTVTKLSDGTRDDRAIEAVCQQRGVELVKDPKWIIGCDCGFTE